MAPGKRPGGLTALAVLNFVFGGLGLIGVLALFALLSAASTAFSEAAAQNGATVTSTGPSSGLLYAVLGLSLISMALLITSGIGYLGQKRFLGRTLGTTYGVISIASSVISLALLGQGFGISNIIGLVYPLLTLILLNTTFKDDLVN